MSAQSLDEIVDFLDETLGVAEFPDYPGAENGLQVANGGSVRRIAACTDACLATIEEAARRGADLMLVHHGLFWGRGLTPLTGRSYRRVRRLIEADIALYSAHLPLDAHPEVGNNVELARVIGLEVAGWFAEYEGAAIGVWGEMEIGRDELVERLSASLGSEPRLLAKGPERAGRVGIVSGGGGSLIPQAQAAGLDTFIAGEGTHHTFFDAEEWGMNVIYAGHYATETFGVRALARRVHERFRLDWDFVDHPTGL